VTTERPERLLNRNFALLWQGQLVSQLGNQAFLVATMSWLLENLGSPTLLGVLLMASTAPAILLGPVAGAVADRHSRRGLIVFSDLCRGVGHIALAAVLAMGPAANQIVVPLLVVWAFVSGGLGALLTPALAALLPDLVPGRKLAAANSLVHLSSQSATLVGQAAGGLAFTWVGAAGLVLFDGVTFVVSALCAALARAPSPAPRVRASLRQRARSYLQDMRAGFEWLSRHQILRALILAFAAVNFLFSPVFVLLPVYVKDSLREGPGWYGFLLAAAGAGAVAGAAAAPWTMKWRSLRWCVVGIGTCVTALGPNRSSPIAAVLLFGLGSLSGVLNVRVMTTLQSSVPGELRGRVLAVTVALAGVAVPIGLGLGGLLGGAVRPALACLIAVCGSGIAGVGALAPIGPGSDQVIDLDNGAKKSRI
jgi:MFS family permease